MNATQDTTQDATQDTMTTQDVYVDPADVSDPVVRMYMRHHGSLGTIIDREGYIYHVEFAPTITAWIPWNRLRWLH